MLNTLPFLPDFSCRMVPPVTKKILPGFTGREERPHTKIKAADWHIWRMPESKSPKKLFGSVIQSQEFYSSSLNEWSERREVKLVEKPF